MKLTARRWFWLLMLGAGVCLLLAARNPRVFKPPQILAESVHLVTLPVSWSLTRVQLVLNAVLHENPKNASKAAEQRRYYDNEIEILVGRIAVLENRLREAHVIYQHFPGLSRQVSANIVGFASNSDDVCILDQGSLDDRRIVPGDVVMVDLAVVGRVIRVGPKTCTVRLVTDRDMRMNASISRFTRSGPLTISSLCQVRGMGEGVMRCDLPQYVHSIAPQPGDLVLLNDKDWPLAVNPAVFGEVTKVRQSERSSLRWVLTIKPRVNMHLVRSCVIVLSRRR